MTTKRESTIAAGLERIRAALEQAVEADLGREAADELRGAEFDRRVEAEMHRIQIELERCEDVAELERRIEYETSSHTTTMS
jgi:hypothetical protein